MICSLTHLFALNMRARPYWAWELWETGLQTVTDKSLSNITTQCGGIEFLIYLFLLWLSFYSLKPFQIPQWAPFMFLLFCAMMCWCNMYCITHHRLHLQPSSSHDSTTAASWTSSLSAFITCNMCLLMSTAHHVCVCVCVCVYVCTEATTADHILQKMKNLTAPSRNSFYASLSSCCCQAGVHFPSPSFFTTPSIPLFILLSITEIWALHPILAVHFYFISHHGASYTK